MAHYFGGSITTNLGLHEIKFHNGIGQGSIKIMMFDSGMSVLYLDFALNTTIKFEMGFEDIMPIEFLFVTSGQVTFQEGNKMPIKIKSFQNVIMAYPPKSQINYTCHKGQRIRMNVIQVCPEKYQYKVGGRYISHELLALFSHPNDNVFSHFGNFNLKLADYIRQLNECT